MKKKDSGLVSTKINGVKTYEMVCYTNDLLEGDMADWPSHIQDQIYAALERLGTQVGHPVTVVYARGDIDYGEAQDGSQDRPFAKVIASEIVVGDDRFMQKNAQDDIAKAIQDMMNRGGMVH